MPYEELRIHGCFRCWRCLIHSIMVVTYLQLVQNQQVNDYHQLNYYYYQFDHSHVSSALFSPLYIDSDHY